jgi:hypothetical protein
VTRRRRASDVVRTQLHIDASGDAVFAVLADGEGYADWVVGAKTIRHADPDFPRPGSKLHHTIGVLAVVARDVTQVVREERPRLLELDARAKAFRARVRFELHREANGTTVVMEEEGANELSRRLVRLTRPLILARNAETLWRLREQVANGSDVRRPAPTNAEHQLPLPRWLSDATARVFGFAAALQGKRALHSRGVTRRGTAQLLGRGSELTFDQRFEVVVRFSRGAGLPAHLPDFNGLAVRFVDALGPGRHRDLLFSSVGSGPFRHILVPAMDFGAARFSSLLRYRLAGDPVILAADVWPRGLTLDRLRSSDPVRIRLYAIGKGMAEHLATVAVAEIVHDRTLHFDPGAADDYLVPLGFISGLRAPAYAASQAVSIGQARERQSPVAEQVVSPPH